LLQLIQYLACLTEVFLTGLLIIHRGFWRVGLLTGVGGHLLSASSHLSQSRSNGFS
jgi:hypothetical protein